MSGLRYSRWVYLAAALPPIVAVLTNLLAPEPHGHWLEHLSGALLKGTMLGLLILLATMLGWRRFSIMMLVSFLVIGVGIVLQVRGDLQIANSIWRRSGDPGFGDGYTAGHDLSALGDLLVIGGGLAFAFTVGLGRRVSAMLAMVAAVMVVIPPPFFWPAAGVLMLLLHGLRSGSRLTRATPAVAH